MKPDAAKIEKWVKQHFPDYKKRTGKNGSELVIANPFYGNDKKKFNISLAKGICHDWRDDTWALPANPKTGKVNKSFIKFVRLYKKCTYDQAIKEVFGSGQDALQYYRPELISEPDNIEVIQVQLPKTALPLSLDDSAHNDTKLAVLVRRYLLSRGYTDETIAEKMLMYDGSSVVWPYFEYEELVYWQSRSILNKRFKFPDAEVRDGEKVIGKLDVGKSDFLYGFDDVKYGSYVILVESIFNQNTLGAQALATGGATLSKTQVSKLKLLSPSSIILAADSDKAGIKSIIANAKLLTQNLSSKIFYSICSIPEAKDWNELYTICKLGVSEIRTVFDKGIKPYNIASISQLVERLLKKDKSKLIS